MKKLSCEAQESNLVSLAYETKMIIRFTRPQYILVEIIGVEPMTLCLQSRCSSQLSYTPNIQETSFKHSTIKLITKTLFKLCYTGIEPVPSFYQK